VNSTSKCNFDSQGEVSCGNMNSGVSYFEHYVWDLERRGIADIDISIMIVGIDT
jgi:hypothetical protein